MNNPLKNPNNAEPMNIIKKSSNVLKMIVVNFPVENSKPMSFENESNNTMPTASLNTDSPKTKTNNCGSTFFS